MPQAVCRPWCPATAVASPCYSFAPVLTTKLYSDVMAGFETGDSNIASLLPGEKLFCLFLNLKYEYEDTIIVSKRHAQNGGFSTYSLCSYNLSRSEAVPDIGTVPCGKSLGTLWWKSPYQSGCLHDYEQSAAKRVRRVDNKPTGVVHSIAHFKTGDISVKVRIYQQLQDGDKLSMPQGQKGVAVLLDYADMPIAHSSEHGSMVLDMVMAMASVITRQTGGAL